MYAKQVCVFLENKKGRIAEVTGLLAGEGINIRALSLADTPDFGVLRLIVDDRVRCVRVLKLNGFVVQETEVIAIEIDDRPGGLHRIVELLDREGINIEYIYAFMKKKAEQALVVFKIDDAARAAETLRRSGIAILSEDAIKDL
ncbi:MAG TPA: amino acid-binding protein [Phycisphaerae bacterium]|nr:amino acid-binding protein [Phycisphaerae bacterium]HRR83520.1 amino acid-binding protein [Phycisphaerae bacterium]